MFCADGKEKIMIDNKIKRAMKILLDNGLDEDDAYVVLQALYYVLLDIEIDDYIKSDNGKEKK